MTPEQLDEAFTALKNEWTSGKKEVWDLFTLTSDQLAEYELWLDDIRMRFDALEAFMKGKNRA